MNFKKAVPICILVIILLSPYVYGIQNVSSTGRDSLEPVVAVNKDGVVLVVWLEVRAGGGASNLWYNVFKDGKWSNAKNVNIIRESGWSPQLAVSSDGRFHLAYADGYTRLSREIFYCVYDPDSGWGKEEMIYSSPENSAWQRICVDGDYIYICWWHEHVNPYVSDIVMMGKKIDTSWPAAYERLSWHAFDESIHPDFCVKDGVVHVVYMEGVGTTLPWRLRYKEAPQGSNWEGINPTTISSLGYYPALDVGDDGDTHVVFSNRSGNFFYLENINGKWKKTEIISSMHCPLQFGDVMYNNSVVIASWVQTIRNGTSAFYTTKGVGGAWGNPVELNENATRAESPKVYIDDDGFAHFVYSDVKSGGIRDIYYEKIEAFPPDPFLYINPKSLSFTVEGANPDPATVEIKNVGDKSLTFNVKTNDGWISVTPDSGSLSPGAADEIQVTIDALALDEGTHNGKIEITSPQAVNSPQEVAVNLEVLAPPIYPPLNFQVQILENKALFYREYQHFLTWNANPQNRNIEYYRLFEIDGVNYIFLEEFPSATFEYTRRHVSKDKSYTYELWAVDNKGRTGNEPARLAINSTASLMLGKSQGIKADR